ncbi:MAG: hypothetical protein FJW90_01815 [Actinobacteria bacterium]|nr:hypothetical protein [Actinomycetota bacterium]
MASDHKSTGFFSSARVFSPRVGAHMDPEGVRGYPIDFGFKAESPDWPPAWMGPRETLLHVELTQWGLGCFERYLWGEGESWLAGARAGADHLVSDQEPGGAWVHRFPMPHTFPLDPPWLSSMAQGQGASLLTRLHAETGEEAYAEAALRALGPFAAPTAAGGVRVELEGGPFFEEYPTEPASYVLNGGIFALWGARDVAVGLGDQSAAADWERGLDALARGIGRWDTGRWSLYDLYPALPLRNVASSAYHLLHIRQLEANQAIGPRPELAAAAERFRGYMARRSNRAGSFAHKLAFRLVVPRNRVLGRRMPWTRGEATA